MMNNAKLLKLSARDRETYYGEQVRRFFTNNNTHYDIGSDGCSNSHLMMHQVPIKEFYQTAKDTLKSHGMLLAPLQEIGKSSHPLTESVKKLFQERDLSYQTNKFLSKIVGPIFDKMTEEMRAKRTKKSSSDVVVTESSCDKKSEDPSILLQRSIQEVLASVSDECWE
jgi:hypothetical protein